MSEHLPSERLAIVATIDPDNYDSGTNLTDAIDMQFHEDVMFVITVGEMGSGSTLNFKVQESDASGGTYHKVSGKSITAMTETGSADDDTQAVINVNASELSVGHRFLKGQLVLSGAVVHTDAAVVALAAKSKFSDAIATTTFGDLASVQEIVN